MKRMICMTIIFVAFFALAGCSAITKNAVFQKSVDISKAEEECTVGKTTPQEVIKKFGEPYKNNVTKKGNGHLLYMSMSFFGGDAQSYIFYFKNGLLIKHGHAYQDMKL